MFLRENPVLQNELLSNLRRHRAFALLLVYVVVLSGVVLVAWPSAEKIDMSNSASGRRLVNVFFLGQYLLASLLTPSFAAGAITGEKERKSYEMLLASPLRPGAIVLGKLLASLSYVAILVFASLPIVVLCLPLGGISLYEVLALYWALMLSIGMYGMVSLACSSYFSRSAASLVVSYLLILPLALFGLWFWISLEGSYAEFRLWATVSVVPVFCAVIFGVLFHMTCRRLLYPPDVGSEGKEVVDEQQEMKQSVGMIIRRNEFPDRLFAPPKRDDLLADGQNPVYDKEMRSELFSQGTLMLRLVIQVSMFLALPIMAVCLYIFPHNASWYISYVVLFNMLVGPVFSAGTFTSERERQTLDLLLVTTLSPWQILWGKLISGLRVSSVLTSFLLWPLALAAVMVSYYWHNLPVLGGYLVVLLLVCLTTASIALFCSVLMSKTSISMMTAYLAIIVLFIAPQALDYLVESFAGAAQSALVHKFTFTSPFAAIFSLPLTVEADPNQAVTMTRNWETWQAFVGFYVALNLALAAGMTSMFRRRWLVSEQ